MPDELKPGWRAVCHAAARAKGKKFAQSRKGAKGDADFLTTEFLLALLATLFAGLGAWTRAEAALEQRLAAFVAFYSNALYPPPPRTVCGGGMFLFR